MNDAANGIDLWPTVPRLLGDNNYCVLATANADGEPWATPVFFAARVDRELFWVSSPESRHSRNIAIRSAIAITVFDSSATIGGAEALYLQASACVLDADLHPHALAVLNDKLPPRQALNSGDLYPPGPLAVFRATVERFFVLIRGGDPRFENVIDQRLEVRRPAGDSSEARRQAHIHRS